MPPCTDSVVTCGVSVYMVELGAYVFADRDALLIDATVVRAAEERGSMYGATEWGLQAAARGGCGVAVSAEVWSCAL